MLLRFTLLLLINLSNCFVLQHNTLKAPLNNFIKKRSVVNIINKISQNEIIDLVNTKQIGRPDTWTYNELTQHLSTIKSAVIVDNQNLGLFYDDSDSALHIFKYLPNTIDNLINVITKKGIDYQVYSVPIPEPFQVPFIFQVIALYLLFNLFIGRFIGPGGPGGPGAGMNPFNSMNKKAVIIEDGQVATRFEDVAGLDEAKEELEEIVDYLKVPLKYAFAGAKIPKGVLLEGPPGTGKTLLARAVAGEAGVSFISASGSEFIEMFVGVGAQRVRNLFEQAKQNKPCVIFIDEIDAVGGKRGYGFNSGGNDEREQTLNQILTNMDGFDKDEGIIVLAATNRADTLDPALKRSGRFDRKVQVPLPDLIGRKEIAKVHFKNKPNVTINYNNLATLTSGFSGADLATLANEAALLGVRNNLTIIDDNLVQKAFEKMTIGLPKKMDLRTLETKKVVAAHEVGHAMMVLHFSNYFKLQRVTMNANTAGAGGYTLFTPNEFYSEYQTKGFFLAQLIIALGGRAAEVVYFNKCNKCNKTNYDEFQDYNDIDITTGASADIRQANSLAKKYLELFENYIVPESIGDYTRNQIDNKVSALIKKSLNSAISNIENNYNSFDSLVNKLLKENTIIY